MAKLHLEGFLKDLKAINPKFSARTSSLKRLIEHLERTVAAPAQMTLVQLKALCPGADPRMAKYEPALQRLASVWGKGGVFPYPVSAQRGLMPGEINRICFRGDDRAPASIFPAGFGKRKPAMAPTYRGGTVQKAGFTGNDSIRGPIAGFERGGDLDPDSAVCVTPDMHVAGLFPLPTSPEVMGQSWIYMVYLKSGYNTNARQVLDALKGLERLTQFETTEAAGAIPKATMHDVRVADIMQNLYGREMAADSIAASDVWCAFQIARTWTKLKKPTKSYDVQGKMTMVGTGADYSAGGSYRIVKIERNPAAVFPTPAYRTAVDNFVAKTNADIGLKTFPLPTSDQGYLPSTLT